VSNVTIGGPGSRPLEPTIDFMKDFMPAEPSAVDQLAALEDPDGESAERVDEWKRAVKVLKRAAKDDGLREYITEVTSDLL
jgi:hypothetical protein